MNDKITFPRLASLLADKSGRSKRFAEDFLREFFSLVSDTLEAGDSVKIKGFGSFRLSYVEPRKSVDVTTGKPMEIAGHTKIVFSPAKELGDAVNAPFEAFSPIEIKEGFDLEALDCANRKGDAIEEDAGDEYPLGQHQDSMPDAETFIKDAPGNDLEIACPEPEGCIAAMEEATADEKEYTPEEETAEADEDSAEAGCEGLEAPGYEGESVPGRKKRRKAWVNGFFVGIAAAIGIILIGALGWYFISRPSFTSHDSTPDLPELLALGNDTAKSGDTAHGETPRAADTAIGSQPQALAETDADMAAAVATQPSDAAVWDTVSTTRYLITISKAHYGNSNLWPIIYEENKAKLGDPDRIRPGTPVVVPPLTKYGIDLNNPKDIDRTKRLGIEIYARYGK